MKKLDYTGTLALTPSDGAQQYTSSSVHCTVTYTPAAKEVYVPGEIISVTIGFSDALSTDTSSFNPNTDTLDLKWGNINKAFSNDFYAYITPKGSLKKAGYSATLAGFAGEPEVNWPVSLDSVDVECSLSRTILPINDTDNQTPADADVNMVVVKATVTHGGNPVEGYVINWAPGIDNKPFGGIGVRVFAADNNKYVLATHRTMVVNSGTVDCIATETNELGQSVINIVPTSNPLCLGLTAISSSGGAGQTSIPNITIFDPAPPLDVLNVPAIELGKDGRGNYNLDTAPGNYVPITLPAADVAAESYQFFIFNNYENRKAPVYSIEKYYDKPIEALPISLVLSKAVFDSISEDNDSGQNLIFYVRSGSGGVCRTSAWNKGDYVGTVAAFAPDPTIDPRDLDEPTVPYAGVAINVNTIQKGLVVRLPVYKMGEWADPQAGDTMYTTIYFSGWQYGSHKRVGNTISIASQITQVEINKSSIDVNFDSGPLFGFQANPDDQDEQSILYVEYYVVKAGDDDIPDDRMYSRYRSYPLTTAV